MRIRKSNRIKKKRAILLAFCFLLSVASMSASATDVKNTINYKHGYNAGVKDGYKIGYHDGLEDCLKYGHEEVLTKIPTPAFNNYLTNNYKKGFRVGINKGYVAGYNAARFGCLKDWVL